MLARRIERRYISLATGLSVMLAGAIITFATFIYPTLSLRPEYDNYLVMAIIVGLLPVATLQFMDMRWRRQAEEKIPNLIRDVVEANKSGMPFLKAIEYTATLNYGVLTEEVRRAVSKMRLGVPYDEALMDLARRIDTPLAYRTAILLIEVGRHGGRIQEMLEEVYAHIRELQDLLRDRRRQITPYLGVVYAAFGVFIFTVIVLFMTFFGQLQGLIQPMPGMEGVGAPGVMPLSTAGLDPRMFHLWFYHMSIVEALIGGFVAGKMSEGTMAAGLKHALILLILSFVVFSLIIPQFL